MGEENQNKKMLGLVLIFGWSWVIFYSSYMIEKGLTEIGTGLISFLEKMADRWPATASWDLSWLEEALKEIVHVEAFVLLGVFLAVVLSWWGIRGRRKWQIMSAAAFFISIGDEGFQHAFGSGSFRVPGLMIDLLAVLAGIGIFSFIQATNREDA